MRLSELIPLLIRIMETENRDMLVEMVHGEYTYPVRTVLLSSVANEKTGDTKLIVALSHEEKADVPEKYI